MVRPAGPTVGPAPRSQRRGRWTEPRACAPATARPLTSADRAFPSLFFFHLSPRRARAKRTPKTDGIGAKEANGGHPESARGSRGSERLCAGKASRTGPRRRRVTGRDGQGSRPRGRPGGVARTGRRLSALLSGPGNHRKGRAPRGCILGPLCSAEVTPQPPLQKAGLSLTVCSQEPCSRTAS